jgi:2-polyprenyl-6-methoxyphenol hydroxylase-like FAD-dependent oxidoreductase
MDEHTPGPTAAIIGASLAGLFAAAATSAAGYQVTLLDRDDLDEHTLAHAGVPQGRQPHVYLLRGLQAAEDLLPGLHGDLLTAGAVEMDTTRLAVLSEQGWVPVHSSDLVGLSMSRPLFERVVRRRVLGLPAVRMSAGRSVNGLRRPNGPDGSWHVLTAAGQIAADLVVDASGRGSRLPTWLASLGVEAPSTEEVDARIGYSVREYSDGPDLDGLVGILIGTTPETGRGGLALPIEDGRWMVLASGAGDRRPPRDVDGYLAALRAQRDPALADFADRATPVGDVLIYRRNGNRRHRYENCRDWPAGLLAVGDSLVTFNPIYGQGITVAALDALVLRAALLRSAAPLDRRRTRRLMRRLARVAALPWAIAVGADLRQPTSSGRQNPAQRMTSAWVRELTRQAAHGNGRAHLAVQRLTHLIGSPAGLVHPALLAEAVRSRLGLRRPAVPRPAGLDLLAMIEEPVSPPAGEGPGPGRGGSVGAGSRPGGLPGSTVGTP